MSADYAAILRRAAALRVTDVPQPYMSALSVTVIRELMRADTLTPAEKVAETVAVLDALNTVQEELDSSEGAS